MTRRMLVIRFCVLLTMITGVNYIGWRWLDSIAWSAWWIAVPLLVAETYSLIDTAMFSMAMWRLKERGEPPAPPEDATVDVFITTYNEPVDLVITTAAAARDIDYPHRTWVLDDGARPEMRAASEAAGVGYVTRSEDWTGKPRHAKAGNLNNALFQTDGEFLLILDADQIPDPRILHRTLGYFDDPKIGLVQTPQYFTNVDDADILGSQAPLFYGPIQQGKDGWNAAFFCGSNAVLRRDALMQLGIVGYVQEVGSTVRRAIRTADTILSRAAKEAPADDPAIGRAITEVKVAARTARTELDAGEPFADVTYAFQRRVDEASTAVLREHADAIRADLAVIDSIPVEVDAELGTLVVDEEAFDLLAHRELSPLGAIESVRTIASAINVDVAGEAQPIMPLATISVTEDMATAMRLHSMGWRSAYHHEVLAHGLAPEDLGTMLQQRLRWAQGTMQVMLRENPLLKKGLSVGQRLMYFSTMWTYLSGFAALAYLAGPVIYLGFGVLPVEAFGTDFFIRFIPYFVANQLLFLVVAQGVKTWRGQQYSLALFPVWIRACWTAFANVVMNRPLGFVVTPKTIEGEHKPPWRAVWPQLVAIGVLVLSVPVGVTRLALGHADLGATLVTIAWVVYDLVALSIIVRAARFRAQPTTTEVTA